MPKFTSEVDTDAKTVKFTVDGKEVDQVDFTINHYAYNSYGPYPPDNSVCVSYTVKDGDSKLGKTYSFSNSSTSYNECEYSMAKDVNKIVKNNEARATLEKALGNLNKKK